MSKRKLPYLFFALFLLWVFYQYGRSLWYPKYVKMTGPQTIATVLEKVGRPALGRLGNDLRRQGFSEAPTEVRLLAFKEEQHLEVYGKDGADQWVLIKTYPFTANSGTLGPKLREGDKQIPEGIYQIEYLNPNSSYHLSAKISYPNAYDKAKAAATGRTGLGGDIMIHGKAATIGCIPIGDLAMEELFILLERALPRGVEVIISPRDFRVDPSYPVVDRVNWTDELYEKIAVALQ